MCSIWWEEDAPANIGHGWFFIFPQYLYSSGIVADSAPVNDRFVLFAVSKLGLEPQWKILDKNDFHLCIYIETWNL